MNQQNGKFVQFYLSNNFSSFSYFNLNKIETIERLFEFFFILGLSLTWKKKSSKLYHAFNKKSQTKGRIPVLLKKSA